MAFATFLVWWLRIGACGVGACGFWRLWFLALMTATHLNNVKIFVWGKNICMTSKKTPLKWDGLWCCIEFQQCCPISRLRIKRLRLFKRGKLFSLTCINNVLMGSCHKRQKPQAPTPQAPICNRQKRKVANAIVFLTAILTLPNLT